MRGDSSFSTLYDFAVTMHEKGACAPALPFACAHALLATLAELMRWAARPTARLCCSLLLCVPSRRWHIVRPLAPGSTADPVWLRRGATTPLCDTAMWVQAELARKETKDINSRVLDITRKNVSLEQDVKDAQHELQSLRSSSAAAVAAAEAHVEEAEQRAQEAALRVTDLEARLQEATTAADTARKEADTASAGMAEQGHGLKKLTVRQAATYVQALPRVAAQGCCVARRILEWVMLCT